MFKKIGVILFIIVVILGTVFSSSNAQAQTTNPIAEITEQIDEVNDKNSTIAELNDRIKELEDQNKDLTEESISLKAEIATKDDPTEVEENVKKIEETEKVKEQNESIISDLENQKKEVEEEKDEEVKELRSDIFAGGIETGFWILLIFGIWFVFELYVIFISKSIKNERIRKIITQIGFVSSVVGTLIIILYLLAPNISLILASLGLVSAALVVAFQDILSSIVSYFIIRGQKLYSKNDIVRFGTDNGLLTGKIKSIQILRTYAEEHIDEKDSNQSEQNTNKIISVPNNIILGSPVVNFSKNNNLIRDKVSFIITFNSDLDIAKDEIIKYFTRWDGLMKYKGKNTTQVFIDIADDGPRFNIWFSVKLGTIRETRTKLSIDILKLLKSKNIDLAYKTFKIEK